MAENGNSSQVVFVNQTIPFHRFIKHLVEQLNYLNLFAVKKKNGAIAKKMFGSYFNTREKKESVEAVFHGAAESVGVRLKTNQLNVV